MENSILYTFSTIAQALGGAFALLSAFVLFRFQALDSSMFNASVGLRTIWTDSKDLDSYELMRGLSIWPQLNRAIEAQVAKRSASDAHYPPFEVVLAAARLRAGERKHRYLSQVFWAAVVLTFLVMAGSVAVIPYAHEIATTRSLLEIHVINLIGVGAFALCMISYLLVISGALMSNYGQNLVRQRIDALIKGQ